MVFIKSNIQISNQVYRDAFGVSKPTATRHLDSLAKKGILQRIGTTGKGTYYILKKKGLKGLMAQVNDHLRDIRKRDRNEIE